MSLLLAFTTLIGLSLLGALLFLFRSITRSKACPYCRSTSGADRIRRPTLIRALFFFLPLKAYRCYACLTNFYVLTAG